LNDLVFGVEGVSNGGASLNSQRPLEEGCSVAVQPRSTALIVSETEEVLDSLRMLFEFDGFCVVAEATDGVEAVPRVLAHRPDVVILDQPACIAGKTAEILRAVLPDTRIVAYSPALRERPLWADAYLCNERVLEILPLLRGLISL
jgi:hypothetical protein